MTTFDQILPVVIDIFRQHQAGLAAIEEIVINRDLNGRVRLIVPEVIQEDSTAFGYLQAIAADLAHRLGPHGYGADRAILFEPDVAAVCRGEPSFPLEGFANVTVVDRLVTESDWAAIGQESEGTPRVVFYSIKGGVGRSTALAAVAWALAQQGRRVLVLDVDLESPGLSSALLPEERRPAYGITDWLVEDLVDNGDAVFDDLIATSPLSHDGEIYVVPAHGKEPGEYVAKLGRVWMAKGRADGGRESWSRRLARLIDALDQRLRPDILLIDSRAGIDEVAASCITDLGATLILLFALDGEQTWSGYRVLFRHWNRAGKAQDIRERLQLVGAMIPDDEGRVAYFEGLRERAWNAFAEELYDQVPPGASTAGLFSFEEADDSAPHYPWPIRWNRGFAALRSLHARLKGIDESEVRSVFGALIDGVAAVHVEAVTARMERRKLMEHVESVQDDDHHARELAL